LGVDISMMGVGDDAEGGVEEGMEME